MTLTIALATAVSGLRANTAQTELISNNVSNAVTPGYVRRELALSPVSLGGEGAGVRIDGVQRLANPGLAESTRLAEASAGEKETAADALRRLADAAGDPGEGGALAAAADAFEAALAAAADTPESGQILSVAVNKAVDYTAAINRIAAEAMALRTETDASIAKQAATINDTLTKVQSLNAEIKARVAAGADASSLEDQRDKLIRDISAIIPVKVVRREFDEVALFTRNGQQLLDGKVFELGFSPTNVVTPDLTFAGGALSGLTVNGNPVRIGEGDGRGFMDGGSLAAAFELRDRTIPEITAGLDDLAADLIERVQGLAADPTLAPGAAGLFTDDGAAFAPANLTGLSLRIAVSAAVDPAAGGAVFRLRDGVGAATPGESGTSAVLRGLLDAVREPVDSPAGSLLTGRRGAAGFAADFSSTVLSRAASDETEAAFRRGKADEFGDAELAVTGVDTDQELAKLIVVEQAFAANARVVQVVDELLEILTSL